MAKHYYSLAHANAALPALQRAFAGVLQLRGRLRALYSVLDDAGHPPEDDEPPAELPDEVPDDVRRDVAKFYGLVDALRALVAEIQDTGCTIKDVERGLVDWLALSGGREVYLCWRFGEPEVAYYHEVHAGFAGRRPVSELEPPTPALAGPDDGGTGLLR
jgi:hypothetical protein